MNFGFGSRNELKTLFLKCFAHLRSVFHKITSFPLVFTQFSPFQTDFSRMLLPISLQCANVWKTLLNNVVYLLIVFFRFIAFGSNERFVPAKAGQGSTSSESERFCAQHCEES